MTRRVLMVVGVTGPLACGLAAPAFAATKTVVVGGHGFAGAPANLQALALLPGMTSVHVGDSVRFRIAGGLIHTATFVPRGQTAPPFDMVDPAHPVSGVTDAAGMPFSFNGQPRPIVNPVAAFPTTGRTVTGRAYVNSGIPSDQAKGSSFRMTFPRRGRSGWYASSIRGCAAPSASCRARRASRHARRTRPPPGGRSARS